MEPAGTAPQVSRDQDCCESRERGPRLSPSELRPGDVLLYHGHTPFARLVQRFDEASSFHAALVVTTTTAVEALFLSGGLAEQTFPASFVGREWALVRRPHSSAAAAALAQAWKAHDEQHRYAVEHLVGLGLLCLARRSPQTTRYFTMVACLLETATLEISAWAAFPGKQPLVCSEFVWWCFAESPPRGLHRLAVPDREGLESLDLRGIESGSLLSRLKQSGWKEVPDLEASFPTPPNGELEKAIESFLSDPVPDGPDGLEAPLPPRLLAAISRFADVIFRWSAAMGRADDSSHASHSGALPARFRSLLRLAAGIVTSGDLERSPNLAICGTFEPERRLQKFVSGAGLHDPVTWRKNVERTERATCRIKNGWATLGTGVLVSPSLVLTSGHVVEGLRGQSTEHVRVVFEGSRRRRTHLLHSGGESEWLPDFSPRHELDYALLRLAGRPGGDFLGWQSRGWLVPRAEALRRNDDVFVLGHAEGGPLSFSYGRCLTTDAREAHYALSTAPGSSGAPCVAVDGGLAAIHRRALPKEEANAGILVATILEEHGARCRVPKPCALCVPTPAPTIWVEVSRWMAAVLVAVSALASWASPRPLLPEPGGGAPPELLLVAVEPLREIEGSADLTVIRHATLTPAAPDAVTPTLTPTPGLAVNVGPFGASCTPGPGQSILHPLVLRTTGQQTRVWIGGEEEKRLSPGDHPHVCLAAGEYPVTYQIGDWVGSLVVSVPTRTPLYLNQE